MEIYARRRGRKLADRLGSERSSRRHTCYRTGLYAQLESGVIALPRKDVGNDPRDALLERSQLGVISRKALWKHALRSPKSSIYP